MNAPVPIWLRPGKSLSGSETRWMARLSQMRVGRFGRLPATSEEWVRQIEECAAAVKAERASA